MEDLREECWSGMQRYLAYQVCHHIFTKMALEMRTQVIDIREFSRTSEDKD